METLENAEQVGKRSTEPVHRPSGDHIELLRVHCLHHRIKPRTLVPALRAANAGVLVNLDDLPAGARGDRFKFTALIAGFLFRGGHTEIDRDLLHWVTS
jgi:hypothetical protein